MIHDIRIASSMHSTSQLLSPWPHYVQIKYRQYLGCCLAVWVFSFRNFPGNSQKLVQMFLNLEDLKKFWNLLSFDYIIGRTFQQREEFGHLTTLSCHACHTVILTFLLYHMHFMIKELNNGLGGRDGSSLCLVFLTRKPCLLFVSSPYIPVFHFDLFDFHNGKWNGPTVGIKAS